MLQGLEKVAEYEKFVDERLKVDLQHAINERGKLLENIRVYSDLAQSIRVLQKNDMTSMRSMVNLGSEIFVQADVPDTTRIFVDIGLGFHAEFTWFEALDFISSKLEQLNKQADKKTEEIASIKAQIKLVVEGIRELLNISAEKPPAPSLWN